ncbi:MAG: DNA repair exonuclease [Deltaproteobacteria bacterium]|nr:DNA repair exonuclease [Deltaproteobacteria bacterium]
MIPFSFVHTADLHLDSPFSSISQNAPEVAGVMRDATLHAFESVIRLCLRKKVDFLLVAGDVYDGADRNLRAQVRFRDGLVRLHEAGICSFIVHGNHDPLEGWSSSLEWPPSVHIFGDQVETAGARKGDALLARVQGISYAKREERRNLSLLFGRKDATFHIGLLHANVGQDTGHEAYAPCSLDDLRRAGMDYWALGHVHRARILAEGPPTVVYPGNTQGRSVREAGRRGCYLVRVSEDRHVDLEFHGTEAVGWAFREVSIRDLRTEQDLLDTLEGTCRDLAGEASGRPVMARIHLTGSGPLYGSLQNQGQVSDLLKILREKGLSGSPVVWVEQVRIGVTPERDVKVLMEANDFVGELLRVSREHLGEEDLAGLLDEDLNSLFEDPRARRFLVRPDAEGLKALLMKAEGICVDHLAGGGDE